MSPLFNIDTADPLDDRDQQPPGQHRDRALPQPRPCVVLLHSLALDHTLWNEIVEDLRTDYRTIALDLPGHGASRQQAADSIEAMADLVAETLSAKSAPPALVVGLSLGGCVAQALAIRHPGLLNGLVLADTTAWYGPDAPQAWSQRAHQATTSGLGSLAEFQLTRWFTDSYRQAHPDVLEQLLDVFRANDVERYADTCRAMGAMDLRERLSSIRVPTTVLVGDQDTATPLPMAEDLRQRIDGATVQVIAGCKHLSVIERPAVVLAAIRHRSSRSAPGSAPASAP